MDLVFASLRSESRIRVPSTISRCRDSPRRTASGSACIPAPGGDRDSTHSADVDYAELLPGLFELKARNFYIALASEADRVRAQKIIRDHMSPINGFLSV